MQTGKKESLFFLNVISSKILYKEKKKLFYFFYPVKKWGVPKSSVIWVNPTPNMEYVSICMLCAILIPVLYSRVQLFT